MKKINHIKKIIFEDPITRKSKTTGIIAVDEMPDERFVLTYHQHIKEYYKDRRL